MDFDVLVVGELNPDLILKGDVEPAFDQVERVVKDVDLVVGSSAAIFACGAARLGLRVACLGKVGADPFGRFMLEGLNERGIDTGGVVIDPGVKTGLSVILSRGSDRAILTYLGSIAALRHADLDLSYLSRARHLHLSGYFLLIALQRDVPRLFQAARQAGLSVSLDTNYDPEEAWDDHLDHVLANTDIFLPNETEARGVAQAAGLQQAVDLLAQRVPVLAVKRGDQGALARWAQRRAEAAALKTEVVDTVGAGDSFDAGFVYGWLAGWEMERALQFACACGSLSTRARGGTAAQPTLVEALAAQA